MHAHAQCVKNYINVMMINARLPRARRTTVCPAHCTPPALRGSAGDSCSVYLLVPLGAEEPSAGLLIPHHLQALSLNTASKSLPVGRHVKTLSSHEIHIQIIRKKMLDITNSHFYFCKVLETYCINVSSKV